MKNNRLGPRAVSTALLVVACAVFTFTAGAQADDTQATLYHVQESTFGCGDPGATRLLTDPNEPRRSNSAWMKTTIANGRCVTITPRSPWKLVTADNGVALMEYAGTVGAPGSYYVATSELVDPLGKHPGEVSPAPIPPVQGANTPAPAGGASETALAPGFPDASTGAAPVLHAGWSTWDVLLLLIAISVAGVVGYVVGRNTRDEPTA